MSDILKMFVDKAYETYEKKLLEEIKRGEIPEHVAIIMDGNRRFAREMMMEKIEGHRKGRDKLEDVLNWCLELGIKILTVYAFSTENLQREEEEVKYLFEMFTEAFRKAADDERVHKHRVRIRAIGKLELLPASLVEAIKYAEERTKDYSDYYLNIAIAYGGRAEIVDAVKKIAMKVKEGTLRVEDIDENTIRENLYTPDIPDPDLILRTSGEERISNFLLWQCAYSELYFVDIYWPAFRKIDFLRAIRAYQMRKRRFGR